MSIERTKMKHYKLPNGTHAASSKTYRDTWRDLARPICEAVGGNLHSFDPGISVCLEKTTGTGLFSVPTWAAILLSAALTKKEKT